MKRALVLAAALATAFPAPAATAQELERVEARPGLPAEADGAWVLYMHHLHTITGQWAYGEGAEAQAEEGLDAAAYEDLAAEMARIGIFAAGVTEHNTLAHAPLLAARGGNPHLLIGTEYSGARGRGHLGILYPPGREVVPIQPRSAYEVDEDDLRQAIARAREAGAFSVVNHPLISQFPWPAADLLGADAIEVDSPAAYLVSLDDNLAFWHGRLVAEQRPVVGLSGSDYHRMPIVPADAFRTWLNRVRVDGERTPAAVFEGLRRGHVQIVRPLVTESPAEVPLVLLGAADPGAGDGAFAAARAGDRVEVRPGAALPIQIRVTGGRGHVLHVYDERSADKPVFTLPVRDDDQAFAFQKTLAPGGRFGFVRVELKTRFGRVVVITNPLYAEIGDEYGPLELF